MKRVHETIPVEQMPGGSPLFRDYVLGRGGVVRAALGDFRAVAPDTALAAGRPARVDVRLVERLVETNRALGAAPAILDRLRALGDGSARAIITGQQPGVAGGPLMTLHKVATACALARVTEREQGVRCVPVFWMGADDDDFAEIREFVAFSGDLSLVSASLTTASFTPGKRIGDVDAAAVRAVWNAVAGFIPDATGAREAVASWLADARDLADAAARCIMRLTGGEVVVVDGREPLLRECARDLLLAYFDRETELRRIVAEGGRAFETAGYHAQLVPGDSSGLFLVGGGVRHKIPAEKRDEARAHFVADITTASPGVVARNLVQDSVFAPLAVVLGPAEIAYRAQLAGVYAALGVPRPVVFPRMTATFLPPPVVELAAAAGVAPALFALDAGAAVEAARDGLRDGEFGAAARAAEEAFAELARRFGAASGARLDERNRAKLGKRLVELGERLRQAVDAAVEQDRNGAAARFPFIARLPDLFARGGMAQERYAAMVVPYTFHGPAAWAAMRGLADESVTAALDGRVGHRVYSV